MTAWVGAALALLPLSACGSDGDDPSSAAPETSDPDRRQAAPVLKDAIRRVTDRRGSVSSRITLDGLKGDFVTEVVVFSVKDEAMNSTREMLNPMPGPKDEKSYTIKVRARGDAMFLQMPQWGPPSNRCWLNLSKDIQESMGIDVPVGETIPHAVAALVAARTESKVVDESGELQVRIPGAAALALVGVGARDVVELDLPASASAPATLEFDADDRVRAMRVEGALVAEQLDELLTDDHKSLLAAVTGEHVFGPDDKSVSLDLPAATETMTDIEAGCAAGS